MADSTDTPVIHPLPVGGGAGPAPMGGVAFTPPPASLLSQARTLIEESIATLKDGETGAVVGIATNRGWNAAVVQKAGDHIHIVAWVGKDWGTKLTGGSAIRASW